MAVLTPSVQQHPADSSMQVAKYEYITVVSKASWAGLISRTYQHYHPQ